MPSSRTPLLYVADVQVDGASVGVVTSYTFSDVRADHDIVATFSSVPNYTLAVTLAAGVGGRPSAIASYPQGTLVDYAYSLTDPCYQDLVVTLDGAPAPAEGSVLMNAGHELAVSASPTSFSIDASAGGGGTISPDGRTGVPCGGSQAYAITPQTLHRIADVKVDGTSAGTPSTYTFSDVRSSHTIAATFAQIPTYTLGVALGAGASGTPSVTGSYPEGTVVNYAYTLADACHQGLVVLLDGLPVPASGLITMNADHSLSVAASPITYTLTVDLGPGASGTPAGGSTSRPCNQNVSYAYGLLAGYKNLAVTLDGAAVPASGTLVMNANRHLVAAATPITFTITASVVGGTGTVTPSGAVSVPYGGSQGFTFTAGGGYVVGDVLVDGTSVGHPPSYSFTNVLADHTLQVLFVTPLSVGCAANPSVGVAPLTVSFTATPSGGTPAGYAYAWDFGDGGTSTQQNPSHQYAAIGDYTATVTLSDGLQTAQCQTGVSATANHNPAVVNLAANPSTITLGTPSVITFTLTDGDPGDTISWTATLTQTPTGLGVLDAVAGGPVASGTGVTLTYTMLEACPQTEASCTITVQITATDSHGGTSSQSVGITAN